MDGGISRDADKAFAERDRVLAELFSSQQLYDMHLQLAWDEQKKLVDPLSKTGKVIVAFVRFMLNIRKKNSNNISLNYAFIRHIPHL